MRKRYNNSGGNGGNGGNGGGGGYRRNNQGGRPQHNRDNNRGGENRSGGVPRPRKNFRALQEKYLNQAKDAMSSGDRILAEYYLQHADHYHRMNEEFLEERARWQEQRNARQGTSAQEEEEFAEEDRALEAEDENASMEEGDFNSSALPAFITRTGKAEGSVKIVPIQEWDE